jgi:hypothetical protein
MGCSLVGRLRSGAEPLKAQARLEDLLLWQMEKVKNTKKGTKSYFYWMATWREGDKVRNVHLGSCRRIWDQGGDAEDCWSASLIH